MIIFVIVCVLLTIFIIKKSPKIFEYFRINQCLKNIPGPKGHPIIGNLIELATDAEKMFRQDRSHSLKYYPIYKLKILHITVVHLISPEDIELVLVDMKHIKKSEQYDFLHNWLGTGLLTSTGSKWQNRRKIVTPAFHFNILREFVDIFNKETGKLVQNLKTQCDQEFIDVTQPITQFTLWSIAATTMGTSLNITDELKENYRKAIHKMGYLFFERVTRPWLYNDYIYEKTKNGQKAKSLVKMLHKVSKSVIIQRKKQIGSYSTRKRLALLDLLLSYQSKEANIDDAGIREEVDTFMFAGHDTTAIALCNILMHLANQKNTQKEIYNEIIEIVGPTNQSPDYKTLQDLKFMERCIKECLRLSPSVPVISRHTGDDIKTKTGYFIPKNCTVNLMIYDMHRNPNIYPDPERFDPDRFLPENVQSRHPFAYIPFSAGPRNCIGQKFAMLEMKAVLCGILRHFVLEAVDTPSDMVFITDMVLRPKGSVKVKFVPRVI